VGKHSEADKYCLYKYQFPLPPPPPLSTFSYICFKSFSISKFKHDRVNSRLITHPPTHIYDLVDAYNTTLSFLLDKYARSKLKPFIPKLRTHGLLLAWLNLNLLDVILRKSGSELVLFMTSNRYELLLMHITSP